MNRRYEHSLRGSLVIGKLRNAVFPRESSGQPRSERFCSGHTLYILYNSFTESVSEADCAWQICTRDFETFKSIFRLNIEVVIPPTCPLSGRRHRIPPPPPSSRVTVVGAKPRGPVIWLRR